MELYYDTATFSVEGTASYKIESRAIIQEIQAFIIANRIRY